MEPEGILALWKSQQKRRPACKSCQKSLTSQVLLFDQYQILQIFIFQSELIYASLISKFALRHKSNKVLKFDQLLESQILKIVLQFSNEIVPCQLTIFFFENPNKPITAKEMGYKKILFQHINDPFGCCVVFSGLLLASKQV